MRELVLGGEGLIGRELVTQLNRSRGKVVSLDLKTGYDLRDAQRAPFDTCDRVWFLAWDTGGAKYIADENRQHEMYKTNCELCVRVFDLLSRTGRPFLFVTSQLAGQPNAYGQSKLLGEHWARQLGGRTARLWNTYGWESPDVRSHVISDLVLSGLKEGRVRCLTRGTERRRFIYKTDCASALIRLFDGSAMTGDIAGPEWLTIRQVCEEVARQLSVPAEFGELDGSEWMVEPAVPVQGHGSKVSLSEGISEVIREARDFLEQDPAFTYLITP